MTGPRPVPPSRTARIIHVALTMPPVIFGVVVIGLLLGGSFPPAGDPTVQFALVGVGLGLILAGALVAFRIPGREAREPVDLYWKRTFPRAVMGWALMEGGAFLTAIAGLLAGTVFYPVIGVVAFLALMLGFSPGRLE